MFKIFPDHPSTFCTLHRYKNGVVSIAVVPGFQRSVNGAVSIAVVPRFLQVWENGRNLGYKGNRWRFSTCTIYSADVFKPVAFTM